MGPSITRATLPGMGVKLAPPPDPKPFLLLVTMVIDDSMSIKANRNDVAIREGHNGQIDLYRQDKRDVLIRTKFLKGQELFGFSKPQDAVHMTEQNYPLRSGTPLYDQSLETLQEVEEAADRFMAQYDVHTMTYILTDGWDYRSTHTAPDVKAVVDRMMASGRHVVSGLGVSHQAADFRQIFLDMGIPSQWIKVLEPSHQAITEGLTRTYTTSSLATDHHSFTKVTQRGYEQAAPRAASAVTDSPPVSVRSREEKGEIERGGLLWEPYPHTFQWHPVIGWAPGAMNPIRWTPNATGGYYELDAPADGEWYLIGRFQRDWQERLGAECTVSEAGSHLRTVIRGPLRYVPLIDKRVHAHIPSTPLRIGKRYGSVTILDPQGRAVVLDPVDPKKDQVLPENRGVSLDKPEPLIRVAPGVVLRVRNS